MKLGQSRRIDMCGIMGYVGHRQAAPILLEGLRRLEYRGYDSAGVAVADSNGIAVVKTEGKLSRLLEMVDVDALPGQSGIGHTRWATHGRPTDTNAHPHTDPSGRFVVVHNGIIENFQALKDELATRGAIFRSETDTEILAHLIAEEYQGDLVEAVRKAVARATGAYALVAMTANQPDTIVAVRMISPLVVGFGEGENFLASGIPALLEHTRKVLVMGDGEIAVITRDGAVVTKLDGSPIERKPFEVDWTVEQAERGGYPHFMLKEIHEQPTVLLDTLAGRLQDSGVLIDGVSLPPEFVAGLERIWVTGCGTAFHAGLVAKEVFETVLRIPTETAYAHELRYRDPLIKPGSLTLAISQSGETADTIAAARLAKQRGSRLLAMTNVVGSALEWEADDRLHLRAGLEIAVASTKAYTAMLAGTYLLALYLAQLRGDTDPQTLHLLIDELALLPSKAGDALELVGASLDPIVERLAATQDVYFIGRGLDYAVAMEGALKLKEISYLHAEAMPAGELKHGTLALVTEGTPVVVINTQRHTYDKTLSALQEVKARGAYLIGVGYEDDLDMGRVSDAYIRVPRTLDLMSPVPAIVPLQLLAYRVAEALGLDIDQPRNLAKSVTVE